MQVDFFGATRSRLRATGADAERDACSEFALEESTFGSDRGAIACCPEEYDFREGTFMAWYDWSSSIVSESSAECAEFSGVEESALRAAITFRFSTMCC